MILPVTPPRRDPLPADGPDPGVRLEAEILSVVAALVRELHPTRRLPVTATCSLERDLAIDSLGRAELLSRLERQLGVVFPEETGLQAETVRDLARLARRRGARVELAPAPLAVSPVARFPTEARTIPEVLRWHADRYPDRTALRLLGEEGTDSLGYAQLEAGARRVAAGLVGSDVLPGEAVAIMLPTGVDYFHTLHGVLLAGAVPVPIYPPHRPAQLEEHVRRQLRILANAEARLLVTAPTPVGRLRPLLTAHLPGLREVVTVDQLTARSGSLAHVRGRPDDVALLQYTSGSTGDPKGVVLTHANLLANVRAMGEAVQARSTDVFVSWLPLYHDMGLIGACLATLYHGMPLVLMAPGRFLTRPARWLRAISDHGGTLSAAPNFAYEICASRVPEADLQGLDLSRWRIACNGAEPVRAGTIRRFSARLAPYGLRPETMLPVYGLAESSVGLVFPRPGTPPRIDRVRREPFASGRRAEPAAADDDEALEFVCCGEPLPGHEIRVVDAEGRDVGDRRDGRLQFRGPSSTSGYLRNPAATAGLFVGEWLDTGDNAYLAEGGLFLTGRRKDLIIKGGRNFYPEELEAVVGELDGVRQGCVAVFGAVDPVRQTERLVVVAETRETDPARLEALRACVAAAALDLVGVPPDEVVVAPPRTVLKTSSGKVRRAACRALYERGELGVRRAVWWQLTRLALSGVLPRLRRLGRAAVARLYAAWAWTVAGLLAPLLWLAIPLVPGPRRRRALARSALRLAAFLAGVRLRVTGLEHLEGGGPFVVVANHASYVDALVVSAVLPTDAVFAAKEELEGSWLFGWHLRLLGHVFVERFDPKRAMASADALLEVARRGESPVLFAEGTFVRAPGLHPFHLGAFTVAARSGTPVLPVALRGTRDVLPEGSWAPRRATVEVTIGPPLAPAGEGWGEALRLRDATRAAILQACGEPDLASDPVRPPGAPPPRG